jgi:hypothetical protein
MHAINSQLLSFFTFFHRNAIYAQRRVEGTFLHPDEPIGVQDKRYNTIPMETVAHADVKHSSAGIRGNISGHEEYALQAQQRRDELLAKYANAAAQE